MSSSLSDVLLEFLEAATHCLIYARGVYPKAIFDRRTIYGLVVHWSRHPEVNKYIQDVLSQTKPLLESGCVSDVAVLFTKSTDNTVIERVVFHIGQAYKPPQHSVKAAASETDEKADDVADVSYLPFEFSSISVCLNCVLTAPLASILLLHHQSVKALRSALLCLMRASPPEKAKAAAEHGKLLFEMQVSNSLVSLGRGPFGMLTYFP
jgi:hypothetical protein